MLAAIENSREIAAGRGLLRGFRTAGFQELKGTDEAPLKIERGSAEQSNTSVRFGGRLILKMFRKLEQGPNPDFEIGRYLTEDVGFTRIPKLAGWIEYSADGSAPTTVAMLQALVRNQGDGWQWTLDELGRYYEHCSASGNLPEDRVSVGTSLIELAETPIPQAAADMVGFYLDSAGVLGKRTAQMHCALAQSSDPAFAPEPLSSEQLAELADRFKDHATEVLDTLKAKLASLPDDIVDRAAILSASGDVCSQSLAR